MKTITIRNLTLVIDTTNTRWKTGRGCRRNERLASGLIDTLNRHLECGPFTGARLIVIKDPPDIRVSDLPY